MFHNIMYQMKTQKYRFQLTVMGTPAEEQNGGKARMIDAGAFKNVDVAMMAHPSKYEVQKPNYIATKEYMPCFHFIML